MGHEIGLEIFDCEDPDAVEVLMRHMLEFHEQELFDLIDVLILEEDARKAG